MAKFRFGVQCSQTGSASEWRDHARKLEDLGYSTLFMPDHFGEELAPMPAIAMAALCGVAARGLAGVRQRLQAPRILAKEAATIDILSDGRLELGVNNWTDRLRPARPSVRPARRHRPLRGGAPCHQAVPHG
jgi:alkanesulfonate monooxygenase SsuD/methylene tetrahydromethanopterin reductase-like flavin-dependent oxidoreductase (luciferase family)